VSRIITLTTDFGLKDAYVGAMKGVILSIHPEVRIVDISHEISPQEIMEAAFVLRDAAFYFPTGTIHIVVVDPGVGTSRAPLALRAAGHTFVGPDNGVLPLLLNDTPADECVVLEPHKFRGAAGISSTFHGRDIFAPAAAHLACGVPLRDLGRACRDLKPLHWALPMADDEGVQGWIVHIDHFGNCITNVSRQILDDKRVERPVKCFIGNAIIGGISTTYGDVETGEPLVHFNSSDFLEFAVNAGNAAELHGIRKGDPVKILFREQK
jgi:hypothetical protein